MPRGYCNQEMNQIELKIFRDRDCCKYANL